MILYIFNHPFPDNSGFTNRCRREIDALSKQEDVIIICRGYKSGASTNYVSPYRDIPVHTFTAKSVLMENPKQYFRGTGLYEVIRNVDLMYNLSKTLFYVFSKYRNSRSVRLYTVSSPLTVPLTAYIIGRLFRFVPFVLEMHDLEPEQAMHIKNIPASNIVIRLEYYLERFLARRYQKIIVTTETQASSIIARTGINPRKIFSIPNLVSIPKKNSVRPQTIRNKYKIPSNTFTVAYVSNFTYPYSVDGLKDMLPVLKRNINKLKNVLFLIIGEGEQLAGLKSLINKHELGKHFLFTGKVSNVDHLLSISKVGMVPWRRCDMTETMLPTKLFEYMANGVIPLIPAFGEFTRFISRNENGLLYDSPSDFVRILVNMNKSAVQFSKLSLNTYRHYRSIIIPDTEKKYLSYISS